MAKKKKPYIPSAAEIAQSGRGDWGNISPVTKVIENKKKNPKIKYKGKEDYENA